MAAYALVDLSNTVIAVLNLEAGSGWTQPANTQLVLLGNTPCGVGWTYNGSTFDQPANQQQAALLTGLRQASVNALPITEDKYTMLLRALVLTLVDELNAHADKINAILMAIDNGTNLAAVKANIAAIVDYPTRTAAQVKTAMVNQITAGDADD